MEQKDFCSKFWGNKLMYEALVRGVKTNDTPTQLKLAKAEAEYSQKCGMYDEKELKCININAQLQALIQLQGASALSPFESSTKQYDSTNAIARYRKEFNDNNCTQIIEKYRQSELGDVVSKFSALDKARIEAESIYERNQRIFFGGLVLIGGVVIITMFSKKK
jgi:hypothetical protein